MLKQAPSMLCRPQRKKSTKLVSLECGVSGLTISASTTSRALNIQLQQGAFKNDKSPPVLISIAIDTRDELLAKLAPLKVHAAHGMEQM